MYVLLVINSVSLLIDWLRLVLFVDNWTTDFLRNYWFDFIELQHRRCQFLSNLSWDFNTRVLEIAVALLVTEHAALQVECLSPPAAMVARVDVHIMVQVVALQHFQLLIESHFDNWLGLFYCASLRGGNWLLVNFHLVTHNWLTTLLISHVSVALVHMLKMVRVTCWL